MRRVMVVVLLVALAGCGGSDRPTKPVLPKLSDKEQVVRTLLQAMDQGDCAAVKRVVVTPSAIDCAQLTEVSGMFIAEGIDPDNARYEDGEASGDSATVKITWNDTSPAETMDVQRVDGTWLVVFDSAP